MNTHTKRFKVARATDGVWGILDTQTGNDAPFYSVGADVFPYVIIIAIWLNIGEIDIDSVQWRVAP